MLEEGWQAYGFYPFPNRFTMTTPEMAIAPPRRESQVGNSPNQIQAMGVKFVERAAYKQSPQRSRRCYQALQPPSTARIAPLVNFAASDAR
jgi:hypothetical protein